MVTQLVFADGLGNSAASTPSAGGSNGDGGAPQDEQIFGTGSVLNSTHLSSRSMLEVSLTKIVHYLKHILRAGSAGQDRLRVLGVEYASNASDARKMVSAKREVIVAAGALHTPQLLMVSGVGPAAVLKGAAISQRIDLPGVGANLQDHLQVGCWYPYRNPAYLYPDELNTDQNLVDLAWNEYWTTRTGPFASGAIDGVAFLSLPDTTSSYSTVVHLAASQSPAAFLPPNSDSRIVAGYAKQVSLLTGALSDRNRAAWEIINANDGDLAVANMRPFSRGSVSLQSADPFLPPLIDLRYGSNPIDTIVLQAAIWFNTRLLNTPALAELDPEFVSPAANASIEEIGLHIRTRAQTEYHVSGTAAMMPRELGGVVDPSLMVYGTSNLRVVDASIFPMLPAAHLQAVVYGVAEKAADMIKSSNQAAQPASILSGGRFKLSITTFTTNVPSSVATSSPTVARLVKLTTFVTTYTTWI